jgi:hypothetical protein
MFTFPPQAAFDRTIAKARICDHAQPSKKRQKGSEKAKRVRF